MRSLRALCGPFRVAVMGTILIGVITPVADSSAWQKPPGDVNALPPLPIGRAVELELNGGDMKLFFVRLKLGEVLRVEVQEHDINVKVLLTTPDLNEELARSNVGSRHERETATLIAKAGRGVLVVIVAPKGQERGSFRLTATVKPAYGPQDEQRVAAEKMLSEAAELLKATTTIPAASLATALSKAEQATTIWHALGETYWEAYGLMLTGLAQARMERDEQGLATLNRALPLWVSAGAKHGEAHTHGLIAVAHIGRKEHDKALAALAKAMMLLREIHERKCEADFLALTSHIHKLLGVREKAEVYWFANSFRLSRDDRGMASTLYQLGGNHMVMGSYRIALYYYELALEYAQAGEDKNTIATILRGMGLLYIELERPEQASEKIERSLRLFRELRDESGVAGSLASLCDIQLKLNNPEKALSYANQALALAGKTGPAGGVLQSAADAHNAVGQPQKALTYLHRALLLEKGETLGSTGEPTLLQSMMVAWRALGNKRLAVFYGKQAVRLYERWRSMAKELDQAENLITPDRTLHKQFHRRHETVYKELIGLLIEEGRLPEAQEVLSALKDQQYFDAGPSAEPSTNIPFVEKMGRQAVAVLSHTPREADAAARYGRTSQAILDIPDVFVVGKTLSAQNQGRLKAAVEGFASELKHIEADFAQPPSSKDESPDIAGVRNLQTTLSELDASTRRKTAAVYTVVGDKRYYVLVVTANGINAASHPVRGVDLNQQALRMWALLQNDTYDPARVAQGLYSVVFKPLEAKLPGDVKTILWSLDGNLRYVPMAALHDGRGYLIERYSHVAFTRADRERLTRPVNPVWTGAGFGSSGAHTVRLTLNEFRFDPIPGVGEELHAIFKRDGAGGGILDGEVMIDKNFTRESFLAALKLRRPLVHIASHFNFHPGDEALSFLLLGDGTALTLTEMKQQAALFQQVELLTLSACSTAAQLPDATGREIDGFAELAQRLGANAILATLWQVADKSTSRLMQDFYAKRQAVRGMSKAEALRDAQLALLHGTARAAPPTPPRSRATPVVILSKETPDTRGAGIIYVAEADAHPYQPDVKRPFAHPYYWAPFVLIGNWR